MTPEASNSSAIAESTESGASRIGAVYARAFLGAAEKAGNVDAAVSELSDFVEQVWNQQPRFVTLVTAGNLETAQVLGILDRAFKDRISGVVVQFLKVVAKHKRLGYLRTMVSAIVKELQTRNGQVDVHITTAVALADAERSRLAAGLKDRLGATPILRCQTDPSILGGLIIKVGDTVFDSSVANQLNQARNQILNRSVHEIQSRRDRFRSPA